MENVPYLKRAFTNRDIIFLTDHGEEDLFEGLRINIRREISRTTMLKYFPEWLSVGLGLFFRGLLKRNVVYVTFGTFRSTYLLMALQKLFSRIGKPKPHVIFGCLWEGGDGFVRRAIVEIRARLINSVISKCIVNGEKDLETFDEILKIPREKLAFVRYHHTLKNFTDEIKEKDYIFSGGTPGREYEPLIEICSELSIPLKIATSDKNVIDKGRGYASLEIKKTSEEEFRRWMAESRLVVLPFSNKIARTVGHQTIVNAMLMGKPVIVYNEDPAAGYIEDGVTGIVVQYGELDKLRDKIYELYNSKQEREKIGKAAMGWVNNNNLSQEEWVYRVYDIAAREFYTSGER